MKPGRMLLVSLFCLVISACASDKKLEGIPLVWMPKVPPAATGVVEITSSAQRSLTIAPFQDHRATPELIGENREHGGHLPVTTKDNVAAFVRQEIKEVMTQSGMPAVYSGGDMILDGEMISFFVAETNTYVGDVRVKLSLRTPSGKVVWQGIVGGTAQHFGRSYRDENYYETLSDSLVHLVENLLRDPDFRKALATGAA